MQYNEIINKIQELTGIREEKQAALLLHAVLGTLGDQIYRTEETLIASQLPKELKDVFFEYQPKERGRGEVAHYAVEEFYNRVKARANVTFQEAQRFSAIIMHVMKQALSPGIIENLKKELPVDFHKLFEEESLEIHQPLPPFAKVQPEEYHVMPRSDRKWNVQRANGEVLATFDTKEEAIVHADDLADGDRGDYLVIHNIDGSISKKMEPASREIH
jgi:uncharacterized protein (DUF2267 family)